MKKTLFLLCQCFLCSFIFSQQLVVYIPTEQGVRRISQSPDSSECITGLPSNLRQAQYDSAYQFGFIETKETRSIEEEFPHIWTIIVQERSLIFEKNGASNEFEVTMGPWRFVRKETLFSKQIFWGLNVSMFFTLLCIGALFSSALDSVDPRSTRSQRLRSPLFIGLLLSCLVLYPFIQRDILNFVAGSPGGRLNSTVRGLLFGSVLCAALICIKVFPFSRKQKNPPS